MSQTYNVYEVPRYFKSRVALSQDEIIPKLTYSLLKKYGYRSPYASSVSNYDRYLHSLLREIGEEFNDTVITEVKIGGPSSHTM